MVADIERPNSPPPPPLFKISGSAPVNNLIPSFNIKTNFLKNSFFPTVITEWNNLDISIRNSSSCHIFKNLILKFIKHETNRISSTQNFEGLKLLTRMRLGLSHLADHKFRYINLNEKNNIIDFNIL